MKNIFALVASLFTAVLTAYFMLPYAYFARGYWSFGGEWLLVLAVGVTAFGLTKKLLLR